MNKLNEIMRELREGVRLVDNKLPELEWEVFYQILGIVFEIEREEWFEKFVDLVKHCSGGDRRALCHFSEIPAQSLRAIKACQVTGCVLSLLSYDVINEEEVNRFVWQFFKVIAPGDESKCRGYYSRYYCNEDMVSFFLNDFIKSVVLKPMQTFIKSDDQIVAHIYKLHIHSMFVSAYIAGLEDDFISQMLAAVDS